MNSLTIRPKEYKKNRVLTDDEKAFYLAKSLKHHRNRNETLLYDTPFYDSEYYKSTFEKQGVIYGFSL